MDQREWSNIDPAIPSQHIFSVLPCSIKYEGPVDGSKFVVEENPNLQARFRGRPLHGKRVDLNAHGYIGHTIVPEKPITNCVKDEDDASDSENDDKYEMGEIRMIPNGLSFNSLVVWEHGASPAQQDPWAFKLEELLEFAKYT